MLDFSVTGIEEAISSIRRIGDAVHSEKMTDGALLALEPVAEDARLLAPVDEGDLQGNIIVTAEPPEDGKAEFNGQAVFVGPLASLIYYAGFIELGTVKMRAQPFLAPAVDANEALVFEILGQETGRLMLAAA